MQNNPVNELPPNHACEYLDRCIKILGGKWCTLVCAHFLITLMPAFFLNYA